MPNPRPRPTPSYPAEEAWPDALRHLLGPDAGGLLTAVADVAGGSLRSYRPRQVNHQPQRSTIVQYRASVSWPSGKSTVETFVAATGDDLPAQGAALFEDGSNRVAVWRWPSDPFLPGLADVLNPAKVASLLDVLGIGGGTVQLRTRAYRPGRRAVIEVTGLRGRLFLKVVRPQKAEALHQLHHSLASQVPVPASLGWTDQGVVVLSAQPGQTLREALRSGREPPPSPEAVGALLDRLPSNLAERIPRRDLLTSAEHHAAVIAATLPSGRERVEGLLNSLRSRLGPIHDSLTAVHGDLYEQQLLVDKGQITGLLDIDTAGVGLRIDDLANFCAHLSVLSLVTDRPKRVKRYGAALLEYAERRHRPSELRPRIAAAVLSLATGPFRVLESQWTANTVRRLELAGEWLGGDGRGR